LFSLKIPKTFQLYPIGFRWDKLARGDSRGFVHTVLEWRTCQEKLKGRLSLLLPPQNSVSGYEVGRCRAAGQEPTVSMCEGQGQMTVLEPRRDPRSPVSSDRIPPIVSVTGEWLSSQGCYRKDLIPGPQSCWKALPVVEESCLLGTAPLVQLCPHPSNAALPRFFVQFFEQKGESSRAGPVSSPPALLPCSAFSSDRFPLLSLSPEQGDPSPRPGKASPPVWDLGHVS
jgi:hypothetical protein